MAGEQTIDEADLVGQKQAETQAEQTRTGHKATIQPSEARTRVRKGKRHRNGNEHHPSDGAQAENKKIKDAPAGLANGAKHQKRNRRRACQAMHYANHQRAQGVEETQLGERCTHPLRRRKGVAVVLLRRLVRVPMIVQARVVFVHVRVLVALDHVQVHVRDHGEGFDPSAVPDPTLPENREREDGRGLFVLRNLVDQVTFNEKGNAICLTLRAG